MGKAIKLLLLFILSIITGCTQPTDQNKYKSLESQEVASLKVLYPNKNNFFSSYGNYFNSKYQKNKIDVIPTQGVSSLHELRQLIESESPDILYLQMEQYEAFANEGLLLNLESVIKESDFDIVNIHSAVINNVKSKGGGVLYGLAPTFSMQVLYYNKDLFQQYGIPFPKDKMSWDEVIDLANRFPTSDQADSRIFGFAFGTNAIMARFLDNFADTLGLGFVDQDITKVTFQTSGWKKAFELTVKAMQSKAFYKSSEINTTGSSGGLDALIKGNMFLSNRAAMTIDNLSLITNRLPLSQSILNNPAVRNWDVVTVPVNPQNPDYTSLSSVSQLFSINAKTANARVAWELVKVINSDEFSNLQSRSTNELLSRSKHMSEKDGRSLQAFYTLKPIDKVYREEMNSMPIGFSSILNMSLVEEVNAVLSNQKTIDEALKSLEFKGQEALLKLKSAQVK